MSRLSDWEKGMLLSSMTPGSCAVIMGRSQVWVERMRGQLAKASAESPPAVAALPEPVATAKPEPTPEPEPEAAPAPPKAPRASRPEARSPKPEARSPKPEARSPGVRPCGLRRKPSAPVTRLKPLTPRVRRWVGWFLAAGWSPDETAMLFDVSPEAVSALTEAA